MDELGGSSGLPKHEIRGGGGEGRTRPHSARSVQLNEEWGLFSFDKGTMEAF